MVLAWNYPVFFSLFSSLLLWAWIGVAQSKKCCIVDIFSSFAWTRQHIVSDMGAERRQLTCWAMQATAALENKCSWSPLWGGIDHSDSAVYRQSLLPRALDNNGLTQRLRLIFRLERCSYWQGVFVPHIRHDYDSDKWKCLRLNSQKYCFGIQCTSAAFVWEDKACPQFTVSLKEHSICEAPRHLRAMRK